MLTKRNFVTTIELIYTCLRHSQFSHDSLLLAKVNKIWLSCLRWSRNIHCHLQKSLSVIPYNSLLWGWIQSFIQRVGMSRRWRPIWICFLFVQRMRSSHQRKKLGSSSQQTPTVTCIFWDETIILPIIWWWPQKLDVADTMHVSHWVLALIYSSYHLPQHRWL